jgi:hypothetical protein
LKKVLEILREFKLQNSMNIVRSQLLLRGMRDYLMQQLTKEFGDDVLLVKHKIEYLISDHNLKDLRSIVRQEIETIKKQKQLDSLSPGTYNASGSRSQKTSGR